MTSLAIVNSVFDNSNWLLSKSTTTRIVPMPKDPSAAATPPGSLRYDNDARRTSLSTLLLLSIYGGREYDIMVTKTYISHIYIEENKNRERKQHTFSLYLQNIMCCLV